MIYDNILETISNTPMVRINRLNPNPNVQMYAKIEGINPGGSIKDRIALKMIEQAEAEGVLTRDKTIIEATSGNTGIALAMIGAVKGYRVEIVMSGAVSVERQKMIRAFGARVVLTDAEKGTDGAIVRIRELMSAHPGKYFCTEQFSNKYNTLTHYEITAREIWEQTGGNVDYFVSGIGTSGTLMGVSAALKKHNPGIRIVSAEPVQCHYIQGLKNLREAIIPDIYKRESLDRIIMVETEEAFAMARKIIREEGIFVGMSSGAAMVASVQTAREIQSGVIVTIFPDRGEKYLSTGLFPAGDA
ncbi:MAG: cysteine synthase family protein [Peptococcaceae bacterium]|jgi:cysteine synthase B|nr:cysteine synthase family protein [Peptococcaceae bacterium]